MAKVILARHFGGIFFWSSHEI